MQPPLRSHLMPTSTFAINPTVAAGEVPKWHRYSCGVLDESDKLEGPVGRESSWEHHGALNWSSGWAFISVSNPPLLIRSWFRRRHRPPNATVPYPNVCGRVSLIASDSSSIAERAGFPGGL